MGVVLIRSFILYIVVIFGVRLMGKRQLGELQPSELVITILISNIATLPLEDPDIPLFIGILPILTLVCYEVIMSWITLRSLRMRRMISGRPKIIIRNGQIEQATLQDLRLSVDDLRRVARRKISLRRRWMFLIRRRCSSPLWKQREPSRFIRSRSTSR